MGKNGENGIGYPIGWSKRIISFWVTACGLMYAISFVRSVCQAPSTWGQTFGLA